MNLLDKELKSYYKQFHTINLDYINIYDKCYIIPNNKNYNNIYTLFEFCILLRKYKYIRQYC